MTLFIVATPIGNLGDISFRAVDTLKNVEMILCEDTRHTGKLLKAYDIDTPMSSFHSYTKPEKTKNILDQLEQGHSFALVSDAGTPGISDPAYALTSEAQKRNIQIVPIPGASAFLTALSASGVPINTFIYLGFLPVKKGRKTLLESLKEEKRTMVFYESPHRIVRTLEDLSLLFGKNREVIIAREMTKIFEEFQRGSLEEISEIYNKKTPKGEFVVIVPAVQKKKVSPS